jgi:MFS family permease
MNLSLSKGVTNLHFVIYLFAALLSISFFVFLNASQAFVLGEILLVPKESLGDVSGSLGFYDEILSVFMVLVWGIISDSIGRKIVYISGFIILSVALYLFTFAVNVYPQLLLFRLIFSLGGAATSAMLTAVLADFVAGESTRGKLAGSVGLSTGLGALVALFGFLPLITKVGAGVKGIRNMYIIVGSIGIAFSIILAIWFPNLKADIDRSQEDLDDYQDSPNSEAGLLPSHENLCPITERVNSSEGETNLSPSFIDKIKVYYKNSLEYAIEGIKQAKNPHVLLGYMGSFLARGDSIILTVFIPLWVYKNYISSGKCAGDPSNPEIKESCTEAYIKASILSGVAQTFALVFAPIIGYLLDKYNRVLIMVIAGLVGFIGYFCLFFSKDLSSNVVYLYVILAGIGEIGMITGSLSLVTNASVSPKVRGSVAGVSSFFGAIGILLNTKLGGYLFDVWREGAPFLLVAIGHGIVGIVGIALLVLKLG